VAPDTEEADLKISVREKKKARLTSLVLLSATAGFFCAFGLSANAQPESPNRTSVKARTCRTGESREEKGGTGRLSGNGSGSGVGRGTEGGATGGGESRSNHVRIGMTGDGEEKKTYQKSRWGQRGLLRNGRDAEEDEAGEKR